MDNFDCVIFRFDNGKITQCYQGATRERTVSKNTYNCKYNT